MKRIQKISSFLQVILLIMLVALPLEIYLKWFGQTPDWMHIAIDWTYVATPEGVVDLSSRDLPFHSRLTCSLGNAIESLPFFLGIIVVRKLFRNYKKGEIFSLENIGYFRWIGWLFFINGLLARPLCGMFKVLGATLSNPAGHRYITISFGSPNIESLICGCIILVISWVMREGYAFQEDQKLTI